MEERSNNVSRRTFVKTGAALGGLAAVGAATAAGASLGEGVPQALAEQASAGAGEEREVFNYCAVDCQASCALKFHVKNDEILWVDAAGQPEDGLEDVHPRCCLRGRSYRHWAEGPLRVNYPMKRVGKRGEGKFEQISWDEAVDTIASELTRIIETYGNDAILIPTQGGTRGSTSRNVVRFLNSIGGSLTTSVGYSTAQMSAIAPYIWGAATPNCSSLLEAEDADLILTFGYNPVVTAMGGGGMGQDWPRLRENMKGRMVVVDPRMCESVGDGKMEWQPINPGTDAALVSAIAHELIANDQVDKDFLDACCVGYDEDTMPASAAGQHKSYKDYIMGTGYDKVEKTPEWAAPITGISPDRIRQLAVDIADAEKLFVMQGYGLQRRSNGEMGCASIFMLPLLTGQIGLPGTNAGGGALDLGSYVATMSIPNGTNGVKAKIPCFQWLNAVDHGKQLTALNAGVTGAEKLENDVKAIVVHASNFIGNQHSDRNLTHDIMVDETKCEFILVWELAMTETAKYADILLPDLFRFEQTSVHSASGGYPHSHVVAGRPVTSAKYDRKSSWDACTLIARKMGVEDVFTGGKTQEQWCEELYETSRALYPNLPDYETMLDQGYYVNYGEGSGPGYAAFREDPVANALPTPSGKIEIYSEALQNVIDTWDFTDEERACLTPVPTYVPGFAECEETTDEYPLHLSGFHPRARVHSSFGGIELLKEVLPQQLWINPSDARERGIGQGDKVRVSNAFGEIEIAAKVTPRVIPGTVCMSEGAWPDADMDGDRVDYGGCINTLTTNHATVLARSNPQHSNVCQVRKA